VRPWALLELLLPLRLTSKKMPNLMRRLSSGRRLKQLLQVSSKKMPSLPSSRLPWHPCQPVVA
jgi:hypothetical protein